MLEAFKDAGAFGGQRRKVPAIRLAGLAALAFQKVVGSRESARRTRFAQALALAGWRFDRNLPRKKVAARPRIKSRNYSGSQRPLCSIDAMRGGYWAGLGKGKGPFGFHYGNSNKEEFCPAWTRFSRS